MTEITAKLNRLDIAPRKVRAVIRVIMGLSAGDAEAQLLFRKERAVRPILKLLRSAVANAKNKNISVDKLYVKSIRADEGPVLKRWLPRARGMATPLLKKFSHVTIVLAENADKKGRFALAEPKPVKKSKKEGKHAKAPKTIREKNEVKSEQQEKKEKKEIKKENVKATKTEGSIKRMFRRKAV